MDESLAIPANGRNPLPGNPLSLNPIQSLALHMTAAQAEHGRKLGCLRSRQIRLLKQIQKLLPLLNQACQNLQDLLDPACPASHYTLQDLLDPACPANQNVSTLAGPAGVQPCLHEGGMVLPPSLDISLKTKTKRIPSLSGRSSAREDRNRQPMHMAAFSEDFLDFWRLYPRRLKKRDAFRAWLDLGPDPEIREKILDACRMQAKHIWPETETQFIPYPATWIRARRWEDEIVDRPIKRKLPPAMQAVQDYADHHRNGEPRERRPSIFDPPGAFDLLPTKQDRRGDD